MLKIANSLWRYRRVINAETARINRQLDTTADRIERGYYDSFLDDDDPPPDDETTSRRDADILCSKSMPTESHRETLQRYEMRLDRQLARAYHLLSRLQRTHTSKTPPDSTTELKNTRNEPISACSDGLSSSRPSSRATDNIPPPIGPPFKTATDSNVRTEKMQNEPISDTSPGRFVFNPTVFHPGAGADEGVCRPQQNLPILTTEHEKSQNEPISAPNLKIRETNPFQIAALERRCPAATVAHFTLAHRRGLWDISGT